MTIKVNDKNKSKRVEIIRSGKFEHRFYGSFEITLSDLQKMKTNFESDARRQKLNDKPVLPFDYGHYSEDEAAGWITGLEIDKDANNFQALFAEVDWTDRGAEKIRAKEYKFVSGEFRRDFKDSETGKIYDIVLGGAALTNIPFIRDMEAVHLLSEPRRRAFESLKLSGDNPDSPTKQGSNMSEFKEILDGLDSVSPEDKKRLADAVEAQDKKLSEDSKKEIEKLKDKSKADGEALRLSEKEKADLKAKMSGSDDVSDRLKLAESEAKDLKSQVVSLTQEIAEDKKKAGFDKMLSEGKACEAQRKAFMKDDVIEFAANAQAVKLSEVGDNSKGDELTDSEEKVLKLAEEKMEKDKELSLADACSLVLSENPKLNDY